MASEYDNTYSYRTPFDYVPEANTGNVGYAYVQGQMAKQAMQANQTKEQLAVSQLAEYQYQQEQEKATRDVEDAYAQGGDTWNTVAKAHPTIAAHVKQTHEIDDLQTSLLKLKVAGAQTQSFMGDLFDMPSPTDYISNHDALVQKYPGMQLPDPTQFTGEDGPAAYEKWRSGMTKAGASGIKYSGTLSKLTTDLLNAKSFGTPEQVKAAQDSIDEYHTVEGAKLEKLHAETQRALRPPSSHSKTNLTNARKLAADFVAGDADLGKITNDEEKGRAAEQLATQAAAGVDNGTYTNLHAGFEALKGQIGTGPRFKAGPVSVGTKATFEGGNKIPADPGPGKRKAGQTYMVNINGKMQPKVWNPKKP